MWKKGELLESIDSMPYEMYPRNQKPKGRCCIHKERAVVKYKTMAMLGFTMKDEVNEMDSLSTYAKRMLERKEIDMQNGAVLHVMDEACSSCVKINYEVSNICRGCVARPCYTNCPKDAIYYDKEGKAHIDHDKCVGCGRCIAVCPKDAVQINWDESTTNLNYKIAEYTKAVVDGRPCFHISLVIDVSPNCDCHSENDMAIVPNVGMFASFDPVALDMACVDAVNAQTPLRGSAADGDPCDHDHFQRLHPDTNWRSCLEHGEKIGIGTRDYELIKI